MSKDDSLIYVVDDDPFVCEALKGLLRSAGWHAKTFGSAREFLTAPRADAPCCLILDVHLPGLSGLDLQQELAKANIQIPIIFLTGQGDIPMSVRAIKAGALEFLTKPFDDEQLLEAIQQAVARDQRARRPQRAIEERGFEEIVGASSALRSVLERVEMVAPTESTTLILGETGTGKELIARAIHNRSDRSSRAFVQINCAAIPPALIASELFGHEKGAFTGAMQRRLGRFELAEGGTLFLDEIGELPAETQIALLRVLQEREFERVGGNQPIRANVRLIAATNRDLKAAIEAGQFRSDLYYRLNVFPIETPPLRQRRGDIPLLVRHFAQVFGQRMKKTIEGMAPETMRLLCEYDWPGNVRELQNVIERAVILSSGPMLHVAASDLKNNDAPKMIQASSAGELPEQERLVRLLGDLIERAVLHKRPEAPETPGAEPTTIIRPIERINLSSFDERDRIVRVLQETRGRIGGENGAAARMGLKRTTLITRMKKLGIDARRVSGGWS